MGRRVPCTGPALAIATAAWIGCGSEPQPPPEDQAPIQDESGPPITIECEDGTTPQVSENAEGYEEWCDQNGLMHGQYRRHHDNGQRAVDGTYHNNQRDGKWQSWYPNGQKASSTSYRRGKQSGSWTWWHDDGSRKREGDFVGGRKAGQWRSWHQNGQLAEEGMHYNDNKTGKWTYWLMSGAVAYTETWEHGAMIATTQKDPPPPSEPAPALDGDPP